MKAVFLWQLRDHLKSLRFQVCLGVLLLFFAANGMVYSWKMERLAWEQVAIAAESQRRYEGVESVDQAVARTYQISTRPLDTQFICEGGFNWFMDAFEIPVATDAGSPAPTNLSTTNHWLRRFEVVDWTLIVRLILSFLAVVLTYDAISGEMESGTLFLALANPLSRGQFLAGKFLAHLTVLLISLLAGSLLSLIVLSGSGTVEPKGEWLCAGSLFLLAAALYASFFVAMALGISALARDSAASLVLLVMVWASLVVLLPQASYPLAVRLVPAPEDYWSRRDQVMDQARQSLAREGIGLRGREAGKRDGYALEREYARRLAEAQRESEQIVKAADAQMLRRYSLARAINLVSPGFAFQYSAETFLGTGIARRQHFFAQAWQYRDLLREFFRSRDAADPNSPHLLFLPGYLSREPLEAREIPRFQEERLSLGQSLAASTAPLAILALEAMGAFLLALWAFNRMDLIES